MNKEVDLVHSAKQFVFLRCRIKHDFSLGIVVVVHNNKEFFRGSTTNTSMSPPSQSNEGQYPFITHQVYSTFLVVSKNKFSTSGYCYVHWCVPRFSFDSFHCFSLPIVQLQDFVLTMCLYFFIVQMAHTIQFFTLSHSYFCDDLRNIQQLLVLGRRKGSLGY